ncbi:type-F conjugative transfer system mating-pair stabilization protein TraN [Salmonella enterica subsp. enterica serovar Wangata]|uniref:Type-F conjugative transfer system mating-pair stabilization protein TraN n=1 Tax=Salmonella enterica subsp. enterica serovar Wangata TaxID=487006 RepID=A0A5V9BUR4_SALET|nr:type-F conjugative transfer system mating-pair stabilization protein TraN [Salmonella enterica subsp. enterica serovar Wangata]EBV5378269.1 type-F conjugative transfer system mating-pair stabilization protein TraN [Salmonella enterica subsp. enterica serovar Wangata]ECB6790176.1 type-F conjugative transfer system mating-pair stabilization protein TraN [Salmonella enterica subsp. enterica serovar Wangata]EDH9975057.1 conjugal transfer protein TraN [Salmonella enterica subsp. enterica serovar W
MKRMLPLFLLLAAGQAQTDSNSDYRAGSDFAHQIKGQGTGSIRNFNPQESIPGYNANPDETKYYGGVTAGGDSGLKNDGTTQWATGETGKTITESFMNKPKDILSPDAPFIEKGRDVVNRADSIVGNTGQQCSAQEINRSEFTNYTCERDTTVEEYCTRTATITGDWRETTEVRTYTLTAFSFSRSGKQIVFSVTVPEAGTISSASLNVITQNYLWNSRAGFMNTIFNMTWGSTITLGGATGMMLSKGQILSGTSCSGNGSCTGTLDDRIFNELTSGRTTFTLTLVMQVKDREWIPRVEWVESCPFNKADGVLKGTECSEPGGTKTGVMEGKPWSLTEACWAYRDKYVTQSADNGTCQAYVDNPACTLATRQCAFYSGEGTCLHEYATYSCESKTSGKVMICGGDVFCLDGECDKAQSGKSNDFGEAVSQLAALAAAGKDVAALNGIDVRAFTGQAKFCKKAAAGYSNCCKDSGWGQDIGLAKCSSDEKALAKAKTNKLTVSVGEFCSKKVLGVCLEKKRSYCQFDSKLAQIVQQQGRNGQLHISFGSSKHPDCRGITVDELQQIKFDQLDFTNFYEDLMNNQKIPDSGALTEKVKEQIADQLRQAGK